MNYPSRSLLVANEVRAELARQRRTILELSEGTGITLSTLRRRLDGVSALNLDELQLIADFLGIRPGELTDRALAAVSA